MTSARWWVWCDARPLASDGSAAYTSAWLLGNDSPGAAVRAAARGETVLAPPVATRLVNRLRTLTWEQLTPREAEVLAAVARGLTNAEVGRELFIGEATVKTHLLRIFAKLGFDDRTAAVTLAYERGILPTPCR
jgi:DNA-binding NarL/FixJ family response regulator